MKYLAVKNWQTFQHYKHRNPPWIKLHSSILDDYDFGCLHDASKLLLMLLWTLAAKTGNEIPADPQWIRDRLGLKGKVDLTPLIDAGFLVCLQDASDMLAPCQQSADSEKSRVETEKSRDRASRRQNENDFASFWEAYPRKVGKEAALKSWKKLGKEPPLEEILSALEWQATSEQWSEARFIPHPATYLNNGRWKDEPIKNTNPSDRPTVPFLEQRL